MCSKVTFAPSSISYRHGNDRREFEGIDVKSYPVLRIPAMPIAVTNLGIVPLAPGSESRVAGKDMRAIVGTLAPPIGHQSQEPCAFIAATQPENATQPEKRAPSLRSNPSLQGNVIVSWQPASIRRRDGPCCCERVLPRRRHGDCLLERCTARGTIRLSSENRMRTGWRTSTPAAARPSTALSLFSCSTIPVGLNKQDDARSQPSTSTSTAPPAADANLYVKPIVLTHSGEALLTELGPAQACYPFGGGWG